MCVLFKDFLLSKLCCVNENYHTFNELEAGYEMSSCYICIVENNVSLIEIEAGLIHVILSMYTLMKLRL